MSEYCYQCLSCGEFKEYCKCLEFKNPLAEFEFTREWFMNKDNQVHTIQDRMLFHPKEPYKNEVAIGEHFLVDLIPRGDDVEIWEVENTMKKYPVEGRGKLQLKPIRKVTTGKQFGFPNGYWKVPKELIK